MTVKMQLITKIISILLMERYLFDGSVEYVYKSSLYVHVTLYVSTIQGMY